MRNSTFKRDNHIQVVCWTNSPAMKKIKSCNTAPLWKSLAVLFQAQTQQCWSLRPVLRLWQSYFSGVVWQHKEDFMFYPGASCTESQKLKPGTVGFTQQQFSLFSEDLYAPNSISICYKCNIATGDMPSCDVNQCSGSDLKELYQISSAATLTQCWWIAHSITREVRTIKFECQEQ